MKLDDLELTRRALAAWFRSGETTQPASSSGVVGFDGLSYVVLRHVNGILAVYRVRLVNDAPMLKRLKRWPAALETSETA